MSYITHLTASIKSNGNDWKLDNIGGKGRSLLKLINANKCQFDVPNGFIIQSMALHESINAQSDTLLLSPNFQKQLNYAIDNIAKLFNQSLVAVRSSCQDEDGENYSLAGMFETHLNVKCTKDDISDAVMRCWLSCLNKRVQTYRQQVISNEHEDTKLNKYNYEKLLSIKFAVVVQIMVDAKCSGVCFTRDPVNGNNVIVIEAINGLGEKLVSGLTTPDNYKYKRNIDDNMFELLTKTIVGKKDILTDKLCKEICQLAVNIETLFDNIPQDIEFSYDGNKIWILQARPITTLNIENVNNYYESSNNDLLANNTTIEVFQKPLTMMTWSAFSNVINEGMKLRYNNISIDYSQICNRKNRRGFYELRGCNLYQNLTVTGILTRVEFSVGSRFDNVPVALCEKYCNKAKISTGSKIGGMFSLLMYLRKSGDASNIAAKAMSVARKRTYDLRQQLIQKKDESVVVLWKQFLRIEKEFSEFASIYINSNVYLQIFTSTISSIIGKRKSIDKLLIGLGDIITATMNEELLSLAKFIATTFFCKDCHPYFEELLNKSQSNANINISDWKLKIKNDIVVKKINGFLETYGYRCIDELEVSSVRWRENPMYILTFIAVYIGNKKTVHDDNESNKLKLKSQRIQFQNEIINQSMFYERGILKWAIGKLVQFTRHRENLKDVVVRFIDVQRTILIQIATLLKKDCILENVSDIFHISVDDMIRYFDNKEINLIEISKTNQQIYEKACRMKSVASIYIGNKPYYVYHNEADENKDNKCIELKGSCGSPGMISGIACVINSPNESYKILECQQKDEKENVILVAKSTDPAWTPLFLLVAGVVVQNGGVLSHSAIVAREFGIVCVVNITNLLSAVNHGDKLIVDGNKGIVTLVERSDKD